MDWWKSKIAGIFRFGAEKSVCNIMEIKSEKTKLCIKTDLLIEPQLVILKIAVFKKSCFWLACMNYKGSERKVFLRSGRAAEIKRCS